MSPPSAVPTNTAAAAVANQGTQQQHQVPKDNSPRIPSAAPPPYTPPVRSSHTNLHPFMTMAARSIPLSDLQQSLLQQQPIPTTERPITTHVLGNLADEACETEAVEDIAMFPLTIRINTSINVNKNDNIVCLSESPTQHANAIAAAVTKAIEDSSSGNCGIPMVDGDGNPRPIRIEVDAGTVVDGQRNMVGTEAVVLNILRQREDMRKRRQQSDNEDENNGSENQGEPSAKRRRSS